MPIPKGQFDTGLPSREYQYREAILKLLNENPNDAYNISEVITAVAPELPRHPLVAMLATYNIHSAVQGTLDDLVREGVVDKKVIEFTDYYIIHRH